MQLIQAIVTDTSIDYLDSVNRKGVWTETPIDTSNLTSVGKYIDLARQYDKLQLWVLPGTKLSSMFEQYDDTFVTSDLEQYDIFPKELNPFLSGWKIGVHGDSIQLALPEYMEDTALNTIKVSKNLYAALTYVRATTGVFIRWSNGRTAMDLLKETNNCTPERRTYLREVFNDLGMFYEDAAIETYWTRKLTPDEQKKKYVHIYDANAAFLSVCNDVHVGAGDYHHEVKPTFERKVPGRWHIELSSTSVFNGKDLPHPTNGKIKGWCDTSMVQSAILCGYDIQVIEGYLFREHHTTFKPWYEILKSARHELRTNTTTYKNEVARLAALASVKTMYSRGIGLMGYPVKWGEKRYWYNRPDMRNAIVSASNNRMFWNMVQHYKQGYAPVAIYVDDMYYLSDNRNPTTAVPVLKLSDEVGQFRHKETYLLSDIKHLFTGKVHDLVQGLVHHTPISTDGVVQHG